MPDLEGRSGGGDAHLIYLAETCVLSVPALDAIFFFKDFENMLHALAVPSAPARMCHMASASASSWCTFRYILANLLTAHTFALSTGILLCTDSRTARLLFANEAASRMPRVPRTHFRMETRMSSFTSCRVWRKSLLSSPASRPLNVRRAMWRLRACSLTILINATFLSGG